MSAVEPGTTCPTCGGRGSLGGECGDRHCEHCVPSYPCPSCAGSGAVGEQQDPKPEAPFDPRSLITDEHRAKFKAGLAAIEAAEREARLHNPIIGAAEADDYCGCCGRLSPDYLFCEACHQHVAREGHLWERTWFAQHGTDCPFQESPPVAGEQQDPEPAARPPLGPLPFPGIPLSEQPIEFRLRALLDTASADPSWFGSSIMVIEPLIVEAADQLRAVSVENEHLRTRWDELKRRLDLHAARVKDEGWEGVGVNREYTVTCRISTLMDELAAAERCGGKGWTVVGHSWADPAGVQEQCPGCPDCEPADAGAAGLGEPT